MLKKKKSISNNLSMILQEEIDGLKFYSSSATNINIEFLKCSFVRSYNLSAIKFTLE